MANIAYVSCKVGMTHNSKHTIEESGKGALVKMNSWYSVEKCRNASNLESINLWVPKLVFINNLLIISTWSLSYRLTYDLIN